MRTLRNLWVLPLAAGLVAGAIGCDEAIETDGLLFECESDDDCLDGYRCQFPQAGVQRRVCVLDGSGSDTMMSTDMTDGGEVDGMDSCGGVCRQGEVCVDGLCTCGTMGAPMGEAVCASGEACCAGRCIDPTNPICDCGGNGACSEGQDCCGDVCVGIVDEPDRCGACDNICGGGANACLGDTCTAADTLVAGNQHTCARYTDGRVLCWGSEADGRLGYTVSSTDNPRAPAGFVETEQLFDSLAAGSDFTCGIASDQAACWGRTQALGGSGGATPEPLDFGALVPSAVFAGFDTACVVLDDGTLQCAGSDAAAVGHDGTGFAAVHDLTDVSLVAPGNVHTCALGTRNGTASVWCWGASSGGRLGPNTPVGDEPVEVTLAAAPSALVAGNGHTCALVGNQVMCWGDNSQGQLGAMSPVTVGEPVQVDLPGGCAPTELVAGTLHTCARCGDSVVCWGNNTDGQLGRITSDPAPAAVDGFAAIGIGAGETHTCALRTDGKAHCWGSNSAGQLGLGTTNGATTPSEVVGPVSAP